MQVSSASCWRVPGIRLFKGPALRRSEQGPQAPTLDAFVFVSDLLAEVGPPPPCVSDIALGIVVTS